MKIVFIIDQVYLHGGIERVLSIKANYFSSIKENKVYIITTEQKQNVPCYNFSTNIFFKDLGINYHRSKSYFHPKNLIKLPKHIFKTRAELQKINPDIVVVCSHSVDTYFIPFINKTIPKLKEFHFSKSIELIHRQKSSKSRKRYFLKFADYVEKKYDKLIVLNKAEAAYYKTNNVITIPNPLTFYPKTVSNVTEQIVISAGRIAPVKGYDYLIDIWQMVFRENKDWQLHIYGDGDKDYVNLLKEKVQEKGIQESFIFKGSTNHIKDKMLESSLYAMTSHNECFPLVLLEAQACGLTIISFDCPNGPKSIISPKNGILIPQYKNKAFAKALLKLMDDKKIRTRMGQQARINAQNYSVEKVMDLWIKMFSELINE